MNEKAMDKIPLPECVRMKHRIQEEIEERHKGLTDKERHARELDEIKDDPIIGPLYEKLTAQAQKQKGQSGRAA